jgi:hypothetical protein
MYAAVMSQPDNGIVLIDLAPGLCRVQRGRLRHAGLHAPGVRPPHGVRRDAAAEHAELQARIAALVTQGSVHYEVRRTRKDGA